MSETVSRIASSDACVFPKGGAVVPFARRAATKRAETTALLDAVSAAGAIDIAPRAFAARDAAAALHLMGMVDLHEIAPDGRTRRLSPSQARSAAPLLAWRITSRLPRMPAG